MVESLNGVNGYGSFLFGCVPSGHLRPLLRRRHETMVSSSDNRQGFILLVGNT